MITGGSLASLRSINGPLLCGLRPRLERPSLRAIALARRGLIAEWQEILCPIPIDEAPMPRAARTDKPRCETRFILILACGRSFRVRIAVLVAEVGIQRGTCARGNGSCVPRHTARPAFGTSPRTGPIANSLPSQESPECTLRPAQKPPEGTVCLRFVLPQAT